MNSRKRQGGLGQVGHLSCLCIPLTLNQDIDVAYLLSFHEVQRQVAASMCRAAVTFVLICPRFYILHSQMDGSIMRLTDEAAARRISGVTTIYAKPCKCKNSCGVFCFIVFLWSVSHRRCGRHTFPISIDSQSHSGSQIKNQPKVLCVWL